MFVYSQFVVSHGVFQEIVIFETVLNLLWGVVSEAVIVVGIVIDTNHNISQSCLQFARNSL